MSEIKKPDLDKTFNGNFEGPVREEKARARDAARKFAETLLGLVSDDVAAAVVDQVVEALIITYQSLDAKEAALNARRDKIVKAKEVRGAQFSTAAAMVEAVKAAKEKTK